MLQPSLFDRPQEPERYGEPESPIERERFFNLLNAGMKMDCPCCGRHSQIYRRPLHYSTAVQLIKLYNMTRMGVDRVSGIYVDAAALILPGQHGTGDFQKAKYWHLIERKPVDEHGEVKSSGLWRLTLSGVAFVRMEKLIQKIALIFDDRVISYEGEMISIDQVLANRFNYSELMKA